jgi:hypothetical protein
VSAEAGGKTVYLHIGAPKTGTTYLQSVMRKNRRALADAGVLYPGKQNAHFLASMDLRNVGFAGYRDPRANGAWQEVVRQGQRWRGPTIVLSHETFSRAHREEIARAVESFAPAEVHVVYGTRNLVRQIPAVWQERIKNRDTLPYREFLRAIRRSKVNENLHHQFWRAHGPVNVLDRWASVISPERIHVLTVPPSAIDPDGLWNRFASLIGVDPSRYDSTVRRNNASLGVLEVEFVRRLNAAIPDSIDWPTYASLVKRQIAELRLTTRPNAERLTTPPAEYGWIARRADQIIATLKQRGYDVVGDLDELRVGPPPTEPGPQPDDIGDDTVLDMGFATLIELLAEWGALVKPHRLVSLEDSAPESLGRLRRMLRR